MKTYKLIFNGKSRSLKLPEAVRIAKANFPETFTDTGISISILSFDCNRSFKRTVELVKHLKGTKLEIDNIAIEDIDQFLSILDCDYKSKCIGICTVLYDYSFQLENLGITEKDSSAVYNTGRWGWRLFSYDDAIVKSTPHQLIVKRDIYQRHYLSDTALSEIICPIYNREIILKAFKELPRLINISLTEDYSSNYSQL